MKIGIPKDGRFGEFGGKYIPETLAPAIEELERNMRIDENVIRYLSLKTESINTEPSILAKKATEN